MHSKSLPRAVFPIPACLQLARYGSTLVKLVNFKGILLEFTFSLFNQISSLLKASFHGVYFQYMQKLSRAVSFVISACTIQTHTTILAFV